MEQLRELLNKYIAVYGTLDARTLELSCELDELIVQEMRRKNND